MFLYRDACVYMKNFMCTFKKCETHLHVYMQCNVCVYVIISENEI